MKKFLIIMLFSILLFGKTQIKADEEILLTSDAKSAILMEVSTGEIIYEFNCHDIRPPASMTKIMTMLLVQEAIQSEIINYESLVTVSGYASSMGGSTVFLETGEQMSVENLFKSVCIASANDAAVALAEFIGGTYENFIKMMNDKAKALEMKNTTFKNCNGLPEQNHTTTAYDIAILSCYLLNNFGDEVLKYTNIYEDYLRKGTSKETWLVNTNKLVKFVEEVDGLKTGWTEEAGYCLSATIKKDGNRYLAVTMGNSSAKIRNKEIMQMLNYACNNYEVLTVNYKGEVIEKKYDKMLKPSNYSIYCENNLNYLKKKTEKDLKIETEINIDQTIDYKKDIVGYIILKKNGKAISKTNLLIMETLEQKSFIELYFDNLLEIFLST